MSDAGVVRTHQDAARWYFQFGENCAGNVARVHITGVGNYAAERGGRRLAWREIGLDVREQSFDRVGRSGRQQRAGGWLTPWGSLAKTDLTFRCHLALGTELRSFPKIMPQHAQWVLLRSSPTRFAGRPAHIAI